MASSLVWKSGVSLLRRSLTVASVRCAGGPPAKQVDHHKGKVRKFAHVTFKFPVICSVNNQVLNLNLNFEFIFIL